MNILKKLRTWCPQPKNPLPTKIESQEPMRNLIRADFRKSPSFFVCLSASLLVLGTYLQILEIPVRITSDPSAAEQYDLMRVLWPFGFALWISAILFLGYSLILGYRQPSATALQQRQVSRNRIVLTSALGMLVLFSSFLPWVIAEVSNPMINIPRYGSTNVGQYHELTGLSIINSSYWGNVMYFVFVAAAIAIFYIPISILSGKRMHIASTFLSILGGICIIGPIISVAKTESWAIGYQFAGGGGSVQGTFSSLGIGLLVAATSASVLFALGISDIVKLIHLRSNSAAGPLNCAGKE